MTHIPAIERIDTVSRVILAAPRALYRAHLDREMMACWRTPNDMRVEILDFEGRLGGDYRLALRYHPRADGDQGVDGPYVHQVSGRFEELVPDEKIVERIVLETDDPALGLPMTIATTLRAVKDGTKMTVECRHVPAAISPADCIEIITSALRRLALLTE